MNQTAKKLVESDYKNNRVSDPTAKISSKHQQTVKNYCKAFFRKAAAKHVAREKHETEKSQSQSATPNPGTEAPDTGSTKVSDDEAIARDPASSPLQDDDTASLKRKRSTSMGLDGASDGASSPTKQQKSTPPPPPPPPPPPAELPMHDDADGDISMGNAGDEPSPPKEGTSSNGDLNMEMDT